MRVFIAGATGALGRRVVPILAARGHVVVGLSRRDENDAALKAMGAEPRRADLFDAASVAKAAEGCDVVMHLATAIPKQPKGGDWRPNDRIRTEGTKNLLAAAANAKLYVQESIALVYGSRPGLVRENVPIGRPHKWVKSAVEMERLVTASGRPAAILRCGLFYAADDPRTKWIIERTRARKLPYIGDGDNLTTYVHTDDAAAAFAAVVEAGKPGTWNVADDRPVPAKEFLSWLSTELRVKDPHSLPMALAWLFLGPTFYNAVTASLAVDNTKVKEELGWKPVYPTFREGWKAIVRAAAK